MSLLLLLLPSTSIGNTYVDSDTTTDTGIPSSIEIFDGIDTGTTSGSGILIGSDHADYLDIFTITVKPRIFFKEIWSGDAELPHADDVILVHGKVRIRIGEHLYI